MTPKQAAAKRRRNRWAAASAAFLLTVFAIIGFILNPGFKSYPEANFSKPGSQAEANAQDLAYLQLLPTVERSFTPETRAAFERELGGLEQRAGALDRAGLAMGVARAVALADNGHTNIIGLSGGYGVNAVPFRLGWFADGLFIVSAAVGHGDLLGAQILAIDGRSPEQLVEALSSYIGGAATLAKELSPNFLSSPQLLHAAGLADAADRNAFRIRGRDGTESTTIFAALPPTQELLTHNVWPRRDLSPVRQERDPAGWMHVLDGVALSPYLSRPDEYFWDSYLENDTVLYVQINRFRDKESISISDYLTGVLNEADKRKPKNAIVDLRFNSGGNYLLATEFSRKLPEIIPHSGKIFVLISSNTFSAAISTVSRLKYYSGDRAVLVGEAMGDRGQSWGEGGTAFLPNSKLAVRYTTAFHDWENGCGLSQIRTCFLLNYFYGTAAGSLLPAVPLAPTFAQYTASEDVVMNEVLRIAHDR